MRKTVGLIAGTVLAAGVCGLAGCGPTAYKVTPIPADDELLETTVRADKGIFLPKIALIDIEGVIVNMRKSGLLAPGENPTALAVEKLRKAAADDRVKAVVLRINSPGGGVTASSIIATEVRRLRLGDNGRAGKPVIAAMMDTGASGAYYIACAADEIHAEPTCVTGSIGVIMMTLDVSGLMRKIGVNAEAIKSGPKKDAGSPFRPMTDDERKIFQDMIDEFYGEFVDMVASSRANLTREKVRELADGRVYTGRQAKELGLIDRTGTLESALDRAKELAAVEAARVVMYHRPVGYRGSIYSQIPEPNVETGSTNVLNVQLPDAFTSQGYFMYLWQPGLDD